MRSSLQELERPPVQIHLEQGVASPTGPAYGAARDLRPGADAFMFYVLAEPCNDAAVPLMETVIEETLRQLQHRRLGITHTLNRSLHDAHERLRREPATDAAVSPSLGMVVAAIRPGELFLAVAGPPLAVRRDGERLEVLAALTARDLRRGALGDPREPSIRLHRRMLAPGELVLLAHSPLRRAVPAGVLLDGLGSAPEDLLTNAYKRLRDEPRFAAIVLVAPPAVSEAVGVQNGAQPAPIGPRQPRTRPSAPPDPAVESPQESEPAPRPVWETLSARKAEAEVRSLFRRFRPLGLKLRTPKRQQSRRTRPIAIPVTGILASVAVILALALAVGVWYSDAQNSAGRDARATALIDEATSLREQALTAPTRDQMRQLLQQAQRALGDAAELRRDDPRVGQLQQTIAANLNDLDAAAPLPEPVSLIDLRLAPGNDVQLRSLVEGAGSLLALEHGTNRVFRLDPTAPDLRPQLPPTLGDGRGRTPADLRQLLWMPRGGLWLRNSLLALDASGGLWEYRGWPDAPVAGTPAAGSTTETPVEEWVSTPLRGADELGSVQRALGFGGNLYVLDPAGSQVWRYVPTDNGFDSERQSALIAGTDIRDAVDFAIDGDIYVATKAGKVLKFSGGRPQMFPMDGLDKPLVEPAAITTGSDLEGVYVADTGNNRIVIFDKGGRLQRQILLSEKLPPVSGLIADESKQLLYLVTDRQVVAAALPAEAN